MLRASPPRPARPLGAPCWHRAMLHALERATLLHTARLPAAAPAVAAARRPARRQALPAASSSSTSVALGAAVMRLLAGGRRHGSIAQPVAANCRRCQVCRSGGGGANGGGSTGGSDGGGDGSGAADGAATVAVLAAAPALAGREDVILLDVSGERRRSLSPPLPCLWPWLALVPAAVPAVLRPHDSQPGPRTRAGMRCAGCVSRVKVLLEKEGPVQAASVNLATETAVVRVRLPPDGAPSPAAPPAAAPGTAVASAAGASKGESAGSDLEAGLAPHELQLASMGTGLARMLTDAGYAATMRPQGGGSSASGKVVQAKREERLRRLRWVGGEEGSGGSLWRSCGRVHPCKGRALDSLALLRCRDTTRQLAVAWLLASACLLHHLTHWLGAAAPHWLHALASTPVHAAMSALALLGERTRRWG